MNPSDELLMAFVDGEAEPGVRAEIERALAGDAALRARVAALQVQRERVRAAYAGALDEAVPERLSALLATPAPAERVLNLDAARAARRPLPSSAPSAAPSWVRSWAQWGGLAASVVLGVVLGLLWPRGAGEDSIALHDGRLVATGAVAQALSTQLASEPAAASVAVQLSFVDKAGRLCRSFSTGATAGLACREGEAWAVQTLVAAEAPPGGAMRQAASSLPRAVLDAVDQRIDGSALDAAGEKQARDRGWRR